MRRCSMAPYQSAGFSHPVVKSTAERWEDVSGEFPILCTWTGQYLNLPWHGRSKQHNMSWPEALDSKTTPCFCLFFVYFLIRNGGYYRLPHQKIDKFHPLSLGGWQNYRQDSRPFSLYTHKMMNSHMIQQTGRERGRGMEKNSFTSVCKGQRSAMNGIRMCPGST